MGATALEPLNRHVAATIERDGAMRIRSANFPGNSRPFAQVMKDTAHLKPALYQCPLGNSL